MAEKTKTGGYRNSSIELYRIITMLCIVAHHYVVNSGIMNEITQENVMQPNSIFALLFGFGGKTGINCFMLITGYFMCTSSINAKKFLRVFLEIEFYKILFYLIFLLTGYEAFSIKALAKTILPIYSIGTGFTSSYLIFFLFIPFLNILIKAMSQKEHGLLIILCLCVNSVLQTFLFATNAFTYVGWFMVLYFIGSYIRLYPNKLLDNRKFWIYASIISIGLSWLSVIVLSFIYNKTGIHGMYWMLSDSNKLLATLNSVCLFTLFKNINLKYNPIINKIAASAFGVLMIHANSDSMRSWLWGDLLNNVKAYHSSYFVIHAFLSVIGIYIVCTLIDMLRIKFLEKPFFNWYDKKHTVQSANS